MMRAPNDLEKAQLDFLWRQHSYVSDFIKFADAKSAFLASVTAGYIAVLFSATSRFRQSLPQHLIYPHGGRELAASVAVLALCISLALEVWAVFPRLKVSKGIGPISWIEIAMFSSPTLFVHASLSITPDQAVRLMARQVYYMGRVCRQKNRWIQRAMVLSAFGALTSLVTIAIT